MPNPEEIKRLAEQYAESKCPTQEYFRAYDKRDNLNEAYCKEALKVLEWLSNDYCIVPKSKVINEHRENKEWQEAMGKSEYDERFDQCRAEGAIDVLESLFGTALFNEEKK